MVHSDYWNAQPSFNNLLFFFPLYKFLFLIDNIPLLCDLQHFSRASCEHIYIHAHAYINILDNGQLSGGYIANI